MKRVALVIVLVVLSVFAVNVTAPQAEAWGCLAGIPYCTLGNDAQCDAWCGGPGWGACQRPGCCSCYA